MNNKKYDGFLYGVDPVEDLKEIIEKSTSRVPEKAAYLEKDRKAKKFLPITYRKVKEDLDAFGTKLVDMGLAGKKIAVIGDTSYRWILTYFTVVAGVGVIVPLDKNLPQEELLGLIERSGASAIVYANKSRKRIEPLFRNPYDIEFFISMEAEEDDSQVYSMQKLIDAGKELLAEGDDRYTSVDIDPEQLAVLLFTSGTTGLSKGVMLSHRNIAANVMNMSKMFRIPDPGIVLSILPVHHAYEMVCSIWTTFYQGQTIAICEGLKYIQKNMAETKANVMLGVPLVFEKMHKGMFKQAASRGEEEKLRRAIDLSRRMGLYNNRALMKRMFKAVHNSFGGHMEKFVAGGAAIDPKVIEDFEAMGFNMIQGYGMTECSPIVAVNQDRYSKAASVGRAMPGTDVRIIDQDEDGIGEVIARGPSVMMGYYENEEATREAIHGEWLHTGDLGYMDKDGFIYLTGRKKTVIVTKGGKNIFPEEVETVLLEEPYIAETLVYGVDDERAGNVMITADIYPDYKALKKAKGEMNSSEVYYFFKELIDHINNKLPQYKRIKRINIREKEFEKTTTGKIKRFGNKMTTVTGQKQGEGRVRNSEIVRKAMHRAKEREQELLTSTDPYVVHKKSRAIMDIRHMLSTSVDLYGKRPAVYQKFDRKEAFREITYNEMYSDINALGTAFHNLGLRRKRIAVIGKNCYEWGTSYLATICGTGVVVPLDKELSESELKQLVIDAEVSAVVFEKKYKDMFLRMRKDKATALETLICFTEADQEEGVLAWADLIKDGNAQLAKGDRQFLDAEIDPDEMTVILYTSGTTGVSKGVMLSHTNLCDDLMSAPTILDVGPEDMFFSVLPIHHTYECTCDFLMPLYKGASIGYCQGLKYIQSDMQELHPTMLLAVPLIIEALYKRIWKEIRKKGKEDTFRRLLAMNRLTGKVGLNILKPFVKEIHDTFGGRMRVIISGGAAIDPEILEFFNQVGFVSVQGYGLTECSPMAALNPDRHKYMRNASVGHLLPGMDVKVVDKDEQGIGEICLKGRNVMLGYYNQPEETAKVLRDGWFYTGDLGYVDEEKFIYITGRKKNVIITANGKNVFPEELENYLAQVPYIAESMVWGGDKDGSNETTINATVTLDTEELQEALGESFKKEEAEALVQAAVDEINEDLPLFKKIKHVIVRDEDFEKTTGHKIKRFVDANRE